MANRKDRLQNTRTEENRQREVKHHKDTQSQKRTETDRHTHEDSLPSNINIPEYVEEACKKKTPPCTSIDAAIEKCAGKDYGSKYSSTVESADTFGNVAKGGVRCWQGSSCH